ncbi:MULTISPECIES: amino acid ABC transporter ATP-binding protein [unclassified Campylobacter]|uniref:amino acid ABC transporter ATP-binding protein n=1 Tax=unclassified Campylobacter TaxID=2593542 RepID=UPI001237A11B|nr:MULTISPECIES: amino acid ABC transporter ATP-binding protein [unclassified Campylobacter]KAA6225341.1 amino acid ABC transporter ATP-binding protein [Campylobacter sp. LR185c]KAA6227037.1 amino acid ABC transporter ATP-binding protein [Campylobacter sp. LR196d]KAA6227608.1 amino acid ABC transporter ATP-binding protein [Campylobacter sp. LR286c]KAA6229473.1 amino acid ABC transporter ATP-binding protein [Campylobacter sp. LR264d]KAA6230718.1 amino acid ABC transporter ATP-binding protein [C
MIEISNLYKNYGDLVVLNDISVNIKKGDIIAIIGPSGGGKSTFLRCINLLERPDNGKIIINNKNILDKDNNVNHLRQKISMVFQHFNLFANKNVLENLCLAPVTTGILSKERAINKARILLKKVGLVDKENTMPYKLSGGQKQRIAIARALMMSPEVILFDEPTSALDPEMIGEVLSIIKELKKENLTMLLVTHEMGFAKNVANRVFFMDKGKIMVDESPKELFENPQNTRLKEFLNKVLNH